MGFNWVSLIVLAGQVTWCLSSESPPMATECANLTLPASLRNASAADVFHNYFIQTQNNKSLARSSISVLDVVAHALNTTGNSSLTAAALNVPVGCLLYQKFTLDQIALLTMHDPNQFPGNQTMDQIVQILYSNSTQEVVHKIDRVLTRLKAKSVNLSKNLDFFVRDAGFNTENATVLSILCFALKADSSDKAATLLGIDEKLLKVTMNHLIDRLFTTSDQFQTQLSLDRVICYLLAAERFLDKLHYFLARERKLLAGKPLSYLTGDRGSYLKNMTVYWILMQRYPGRQNFTCLQFFGDRRVALSDFKYTLHDLAMITYVDEAVQLNYTIAELFNFVYHYSKIINQYKKNVETTKQKKMTILKRYNVQQRALMSHFGLTEAQVEQATDRQVENYAVKIFFYCYANTSSMSLSELETKLSIEAGTLKNVTVKNFVDLLNKLENAINESSSIPPNNLTYCGLQHLIKDKQPIMLRVATLFDTLDLSYIFYQHRLNTVYMYNMSVHALVTEELKLNWTMFLQYFNISNTDQIEMNFTKYTFENLCGFFGLKMFYIFDWKMSHLVRTLTDRIASDVDECALRTDSCARISGVSCVNHPGGYKCICPVNANLVPRLRCADVDECKQKQYRCPNNSNCVNTNGSFQCICHNGYNKTSNGTCQDIDECSVGKPCNAVKNSQCVNQIPMYNCTCKDGFNATHNHTTGALYNCTDINECQSSNDCNKTHGICVNTKGSYKCHCKKGYIGDGIKCKDINECDSYINTDCSPLQLQCANHEGSYSCHCPAGYRYHNRFCKDINECEVDQPCSAVNNSLCKNLFPLFICKCQTGYTPNYNSTGALYNCTDIDECSSPNDCHSSAYCNNTVGAYTCQCKEGYIGNGKECEEERLITLSQKKEIVNEISEITPAVDVFYDGKSHSKIFISEDGYMSFGSRYIRFSSKSSARNRKKNLVVPFWARVDRQCGRVYYQEFVQGDSSSTDGLNTVNKAVAKYTKLQNFEATWVLIVTWEDRCPYFFLSNWLGYNPYSAEKNTFQAVVATNDVKTVLLFLYKENGMGWYRTVGRRAAMGYWTSSGDKSFEAKQSFKQSIFSIDKISFTFLPSGVSRKGIYVDVFQEQITLSPVEKCLQWIRKQPKDGNDWQDNLISCPCTLNSARRDRRFVEEKGSTVSTVCYRGRSNLKICREHNNECCYNWRSGALATDQTRAGRAIRYAPYYNYQEYLKNDVEPYKLCCKDSNKYCDDFLQNRPIDKSCEDGDDEPQSCRCRFRFGFRKPKRRRRRGRFSWIFRVIRRGWFLGDPHITTLDGYKYGFNGLGDYVLLKSLDGSHTIHGRTTRPPSVKGGPSNATVFSGFALSSSENTTVQVLSDDTVAGNLSITVYTSSNCSRFGLDNLGNATGFTLSKVNITLVVMFDSGLTIEISPGLLGLLQITLTVPAELFNKTLGILGRMNGDTSDDLMFPNGTLLSINSTDKQIFEYGQTWNVPDEDRLFVYENCSKQPVFFKPDFTPFFLSDFNITVNVRAACQGNEQCMFDYITTGNEQLGLATLKFEENNKKISSDLSNLPPSITLNPSGILNVTALQQFNVTVTAADPNSDSFTLYATNLTDGCVFDNTSRLLSCTLQHGAQNTSFHVEFMATDSKGASQVKSLSIKFCDCRNGGECDFTKILKTYSNLELVNCNCNDTYEGDLCETEKDPCKDNPCYQDAQCTKINQPFGYKCADCPPGRQGDGETCDDFDECLNKTNNNCSMTQNCINTLGGFKCECKSGYTWDESKINCTDIDECDALTGLNSCHKDTAQCTNSPGAYNCSCKPGYEGNPRKECTDINECNLEPKKCNQQCNNTAGSFQCLCLAGYLLKKLENNTYKCEDVDECLFSIDNKCAQACTNQPSTYICSCKGGFTLDSNKQSCSVNPNNTCDSTNGGCEKMCTNTTGVVQCHCPKGYNISSNMKSCEDIDECKVNNGGCSQQCNNTNGTYSCACTSGYRLAANNRTCEDINECLEKPCGQECSNVMGSYNCLCKPGYNLKPDRKACQDIDECNGTSLCALYDTCRNEPGGYQCQCPPGEFSNGKHKCKKSEKFILEIRILRYETNALKWHVDYNDKFSQRFKQLEELVIMNINTFFKILYGNFYFGCHVVRFWRGSVMANISLNLDPNANASLASLNKDINNSSGLMGSLAYDKQASSVSDFDECADVTTNNCHSNAACINEPGSFSCKCKGDLVGDGVNKCEIEETGEKEKKTDKLLIILLAVLIPLAVIILIVILWCCYRRRGKGDFHLDENSPNSSYQTYPMDTRHYGRDTQQANGRRPSVNSVEGDYDVAGNAYDNPTTMKTADAHYESLKSPAYYDNPAVLSEDSKTAA